jgi:hypothetical protein
MVSLTLTFGMKVAPEQDLADSRQIQKSFAA